jgi:SOS response regulatory protein OraA/RecX
VAGKTVTALRPRRGDRVLVELDDEEWRVLPAAAVVAAGLREGIELDRGRLRMLRRELRRSEALTAAARALRGCDLSAHRLKERLERAGISRPAREQVVGTLTAWGIVDDSRLAAAAAQSLAKRGLGDSAIRFRLEQLGLESEHVSLALADVAPEEDRARELLSGAAPTPKTARLLATRGFSDDAIEAAMGTSVADDG